jgi:pimeloyl-ACP methyl ester carboxylesterase
VITLPIYSYMPEQIYTAVWLLCESIPKNSRALQTMSEVFYAAVRHKGSGLEPVKRCAAGAVDCVIGCAPAALGDFLFWRFRKVNGLLTSTRAREQLELWANTPGVLNIAEDGIAEYHLPATPTSPGIPSLGKALLVHGWEGCASQLAEPAAVLADEGYEPVLFDFGRHGNSSCGDELTDLPRMLNELLRVVERHFAPEMRVPVMVCHSAGVTVIKKALHERRLSVERLVVFSVPHESITEAAHFVITETLGLSEGTCASFLDAFDRVFPDRFGAFDVTTIGSAPHAERAQKILTLHCDPDRTAPNDQSVDFWAKEPLPHVTVRLLPGTGHVGILRDPRSLRALRHFVRGEEVPDLTTLAGAADAEETLTA